MIDEFEKAAQSEYERSFNEIGKAKHTLSPLKKSYLRFDNLIAQSIEQSSEKPACKAGCAYCCYYKVEVKAHEVFFIHEHMQKNFTPEAIEKILAEAIQNAAFIHTLNPTEHLSTNIQCPLLKDNQCSIYEARPYRCRSFHATDVKGCEASYANPSDFSITTGLIETVSLFSNAITQGFEAACSQQAYDDTTYDLNTALIEVFNSPTAAKRYKRGKKAFQNTIEVDDE